MSPILMFRIELLWLSSNAVLLRYRCFTPSSQLRSAFSGGSNPHCVGPSPTAIPKYQQLLKQRRCYVCFIGRGCCIRPVGIRCCNIYGMQPIAMCCCK